MEETEEQSNSGNYVKPFLAAASFMRCGAAGGPGMEEAAVVPSLREETFCLLQGKSFFMS